MEIDINHKYLCKKEYKAFGLLKKGERYNIKYPHPDFVTIDIGLSYYRFSVKEHDSYNWRVYRPPFFEHFYTKNEERKVKLIKLNESR